MTYKDLQSWEHLLVWFCQLLPPDNRRPGWLHDLHELNKYCKTFFARFAALSYFSSHNNFLYSLQFIFFRVFKKHGNTLKEKNNLPSRVFTMPISGIKETLCVWSTSLSRNIRISSNILRSMRTPSFSNRKYKYQVLPKHTGLEWWRYFMILEKRLTVPPKNKTKITLVRMNCYLTRSAHLVPSALGN